MQVYLAPLVALIGLLVYLFAGRPAVTTKWSVVGLIAFGAGLLATLLRMDASSFRLH